MPCKKTSIVFFLLIVLSLSSNISAQVKFSFAPVVRTEHPAPVASQLATGNNPAINDSGEIAFVGDSGILLRSGDDLNVVAALRTHAPGGGEFISGSAPAINAAGQVVFRGSVTPPSHSGLFLFSDNQITQLIRDGQTAPTGDVLVANSPSINAAGDVAFLSGSTGVFLLSNGTISKIAGRNAPAPGGGAFLTFTFPSINQAGQVVFTATVSGGGTGIFLWSGGAITQVVRTGTASPAGGTFFTFFQGASLNDLGQVAFAALVNGSGPSGVFLYSGGVITIQVRTFTSIPGGTLANAQFVSLNNAGQIAFTGQTLETQPRIGVYLFSGGTVSSVMLPGQISPEGNPFIQGFNSVINNQGQVAFGARTTNSTNTIYLFSNNQISHIGGQGDVIHGAARFVGASSFALNEQGQVLLLGSTFPGGTGLFVGSTDDDPALVIHQSDALPGGGVLVNILNNFSMNNNAKVALDASSSNLTSQIVVSSDGALSNIATGGIGVGDPTPAGGTFFNFNSPSINNLGQVVFPGSTIGGPGQGMFLSSNGQLSILFSAASLLPGGAHVGTTSFPSFNDQGQIAFFDQPSPPPNGILLFSQGNFTAIARNGDPAPGGGHFVLPFPSTTLGPVINQNGDVAFGAQLDNGRSGIFLFSNGALIRVVEAGDPAPGGGTFLNVDKPSINSSGQVAFAAQTANGFGAFLYSGGVIQKVAGFGDRVPAPQKATLTFADLPKLNDSGQVAFTGGLSIGGSAVFVATPSGDTADDSSGQDAQRNADDWDVNRRATRNGDPENNDSWEEPDQPDQPNN